MIVICTRRLNPYHHGYVLVFVLEKLVKPVLDTNATFSHLWLQICNNFDWNSTETRIYPVGTPHYKSVYRTRKLNIKCKRYQKEGNTELINQLNSFKKSIY